MATRQLLSKLALSKESLQTVLDIQNYKDSLESSDIFPHKAACKSAYELGVAIALLCDSSEEEAALVRDELLPAEKQRWVSQFLLQGGAKWMGKAIRKAGDKVSDSGMEEYVGAVLEFTGILVLSSLSAAGKIPHDLKFYEGGAVNGEGVSGMMKDENKRVESTHYYNPIEKVKVKSLGKEYLQNFTKLIELLKQNPELLAMNYINFKELGHDLLLLLDNVMSIGIYSSAILKRLLILLQAIFIHSHDLYSDYARQLLMKSMLNSHSTAIREFAQELIFFLSTNIPNLLLEFLGDLLNSALNYSFRELHETLFLLLDTYSGTESSPKLNAPGKFMQFLAKLKQPNSEDSVLVLLTIMNKLASLKEVAGCVSSETRNEIVVHIFFCYLFPLSEPASSLAVHTLKSASAREAAFELIVTLAEGGCAYGVLKDCVALLQPKIVAGLPWNYNPDKHRKSELNFVGIQNLGAICYINSMLQQFFALKAFSGRIVSMDSSKLKSEDMLYQLQRIFVYLMSSSRKAISPKNFCLSFKESNGKPISLHVQKDAHEFLNIFFEKLECELKDTPNNLLLKSIFGGELCSRVICQHCGNTSDTFEDYYTLSLEIRNQSNIYDSLSQYTASLTVSDYLCCECSTKCDAAKRILLSSLPNVLIIHLQRFAYNFDSLANEKIHTRFEFPQVLDMSRYMKDSTSPYKDEVKRWEAGELSFHEKEEEKKKESCEYELVGIVIHSGNANSGHYYSYIKTHKDTWTEFNDSRIAEFSFSKLEAECFGESQETLKGGAKNSKSAYMLVYERHAKSPVLERAGQVIKENAVVITSLRANEVDVLDKVDSSRQVVYQDGFNECYILQKFDVDDVKVPSKLEAEVAADNASHLFECLMYSKEFVKFLSLLFVKATLNLNGMDNKEEMIKTVSKLYIEFALKVFPYVELSDVWYLKELSESMAEFFENNLSASHDLLETLVKTQAKTMDILIRSPELAVRQCLCQTALAAFLRVYTEEKPLFHTAQKLLTKDFIDTCLGFFGPELATQWMKLTPFFELLKTMPIDSPISLYFIRKNAIAVAVDFMLGDKSPIVKSSVHKKCNFAQAPDFGSLIWLVSKLSRHVSITQDNGLCSNTDKDTIEYKPEDDTAKCLFSTEPLKRHLHVGGRPECTLDWVAWMCSRSKVCSAQVCRLAAQMLNAGDLKRAAEMLELAEVLVGGGDVHWELRVEALLGYWQPVNLSESVVAEENFAFVVPTLDEKRDGLLQLLWKHRAQKEPFTLQGIKILLRAMQNNAKLDMYIKSVPAPSNKFRNYFAWIASYIKELQSEHTAQLKPLIEKLKQQEKLPTNLYKIGKVAGVRMYKQWSEKNIRLSVEEIDAEVIPVFAVHSRIMSKVHTSKKISDASKQKLMKVSIKKEKRAHMHAVTVKRQPEETKTLKVNKSNPRAILIPRDPKTTPLKLSKKSLSISERVYSNRTPPMQMHKSHNEELKAKTLPANSLEAKETLPCLLRLTVANGNARNNYRGRHRGNSEFGICGEG